MLLGLVLGGLGLRVLSPAAPPPRFAMGSGAPRWCHPQTQTASAVPFWRFASNLWNCLRNRYELWQRRIAMFLTLTPFRRCVAAVTLGSAMAGLLGVSAAHAVGNPAGLPSLECYFPEPSTELTVSVEGLVKTSEGVSTAYQFQSANVGSAKRATYFFLDRGNRVALLIENKPSTEVRTVIEYPLTGTFNGYEGGCVEHARGTVPRTVTGVEENDVLYVRERASAKSPSLGEVNNKGRVFVRPTKARWQKVSIAVADGGEFGEWRTFSGWANRTFLTQKPDATF
jgi:hypothetical protein